MPDWKKVAAARLKRIKVLERRLAEDRSTLASNAVHVMQQHIHARCLASISGDWQAAFEAIRQEIERIDCN